MTDVMAEETILVAAGQILRERAKKMALGIHGIGRDGDWLSTEQIMAMLHAAAVVETAADQIDGALREMAVVEIR